jgi:hypothetical protein
VTQYQARIFTMAGTNIRADLINGAPSMPPPGTGETVVGRQDQYVLTTDGNVWLHQGTNDQAGWTEIWSDGGATAIDVGVTGGGQDALYVGFGGTLTEHIGSDPSAGWKEITTGVTAFKGSLVQADTAFVSHGSDLWVIAGSESAQIARLNVTDFDPGLATSGGPAVFINYGGQLWFHVGMDANTGWSLIQKGGVTKFSASQVQPTAVFISFGSDVWLHTGLDRNSGWSLIARLNVTDFSAGRRDAATASVFINYGGELWEHVGTDRNTGWSQIQKYSVAKIRASQAAADAVFVAFSTDWWQHLGTDRNSGWSHIL